MLTMTGSRMTRRCQWLRQPLLPLLLPSPTLFQSPIRSMRGDLECQAAWVVPWAASPVSKKILAWGTSGEAVGR